ncbi:MAG: N-acetyl-gamma-glutamyl-phosphate reductase [Proteobacteria bacterium]|nr:N-acetyl-gamma-glutamyl-phosphate reductase [Pseudomonadota bacterium]
MIKVGVVGATGYTGIELLRLIAAHPQARLEFVSSRTEQGKLVAEVFPGLRGHIDLAYSTPDADGLSECDVVFFATPNATAMHQVPALVRVGVKVIDLSADFRLKDPHVWQKWYGEKHACPELLDQAVYGLPEINRSSIRDAQLVANPGCYPTAILLGFIPLLESDLVDSSSLIANAISGVSGAGRKQALTTQYCEVSDSFKAYSASGHRHQPEIVQGLESVYGKPIGLTFVPHLAPMIRGIHATLYVRLNDTQVDIQSVFESRYQDEPFVDVMSARSHPDTGDVRGGNMCRLSWHRPEGGDTLIVLVIEDNLVKGAAGQAVQNMNIMFGFDEVAGLTTAPLSI